MRAEPVPWDPYWIALIPSASKFCYLEYIYAPIPTAPPQRLLLHAMGLRLCVLRLLLELPCLLGPLLPNVREAVVCVPLPVPAHSQARLVPHYSHQDRALRVVQVNL